MLPTISRLEPFAGDDPERVGARRLWLGMSSWSFVGSVGLDVGERDLIDDEHRDVSIEVLHRMITYIRAEALRLHVMDVALLLEHAEDAVTAFAPASHPAQGVGPVSRAVSRVEH